MFLPGIGSWWKFKQQQWVHISFNEIYCSETHRCKFFIDSTQRLVCFSHFYCLRRVVNRHFVKFIYTCQYSVCFFVSSRNVQVYLQVDTYTPSNALYIVQCTGVRARQRRGLPDQWPDLTGNLKAKFLQTAFVLIYYYALNDIFLINRWSIQLGDFVLLWCANRVFQPFLGKIKWWYV